jgi:F1F0 ATPase subunit 2
VSEVVTALIVGFGVGLAAGFVFFAGLRATVRRVATAKKPAVLVLVSTLLRLALVTATLTLVAVHGDLPAVAAAMVGLLVMRFFVVRRSTMEEVGTS